MEGPAGQRVREEVLPAGQQRGSAEGALQAGTRRLSAVPLGLPRAGAVPQASSSPRPPPLSAPLALPPMHGHVVVLCQPLGVAGLFAMPCPAQGLEDAGFLSTRGGRCMQVHRERLGGLEGQAAQGPQVRVRKAGGAGL